MNPALKQRLVGAVVLVALAVIFLPMLFDGSGARERLDQEIAIPDKPEPPESQLDPVTDAEARAVRDRDPGTAGAGAAADQGTAGGTDTESADADARQAEVPDGPSADGGPAADAEAADAAGGTSGGESGATGTAATPEWVVQVGSFRRETNALVLRDRLREEGFDVSAERAQADGGTVWRVLIGPVAERGEGEALKRRVEQLRGEEALLMAYP